MSGFRTPPGATPIDDADGLLVGATTLEQLSLYEAPNILEAASKHLSRPKAPGSAWFTEEFIRTVHRDMFGSVWSWAGTYRSTMLNIGVAPERIRDGLQSLCGDVRYRDEEGSMHVMERAARLHHALAHIHPFKNGNGRHARFVTEIYLKSHQSPIPLWPTELGRESPEREAYHQALIAADRGDIEPLLEWSRRLIS